MRVVVFGASGPTGQLLTGDLLEAGHDTIAVTRRPEHFVMNAEKLTVAGADATDRVAVQHIIDGADAVVSTLGAGSFSRNPISVYSSSAQAICDAMASVDVARLVVTSSASLSSWRDPSWNWLERNVADRILGVIGRTLYDDMRHMETIIAASPLDWTIMRPLGLANIEAPTEYAIAEDHIAGRQTARRDLAAAIVDQLGRTDGHCTTIAVATTAGNQSIPKTIWREGIKPKLPKPSGS